MKTKEKKHHRSDGDATTSRLVFTYEPGSITSLLHSNGAGHVQAQPGALGLFSPTVQAKFIPTEPLPGDRALHVPDSGPKKPKLTKKGKIRPPRPLKKEREQEDIQSTGKEGQLASNGRDSTLEEPEPPKAPAKVRVDQAEPASGAFGAGKSKKRTRAEEKKGSGRAKLAKTDGDSVPLVRARELHEESGGHVQDGRPAVSDSEDEEGPVADAAESEESDDEAALEKDRRTIFVGNLATSITKPKLRNFFKKYGEVESCRLRSMALAGTKVDDHGNERLVKRVSANKRLLTDVKDTYNAYLVFKTEEAVETALEANNAVLEGKHVRVDRVGAAATRDPQRTVFLGNVPFGAKEEEVRAHIAEGLEDGAAAVEAVRLVRDPETQMGKGFGFVLLRDKSSVAQALKLHGSKLMNRELRVTTCGRRMKSASKKAVKPRGGGKGKKVVHPGLKRILGKRPSTSRPSFEGRRASDVMKAGKRNADDSDGVKLPAVRLKKRGKPQHGGGKKKKKKAMKAKK